MRLAGGSCSVGLFCLILTSLAFGQSDTFTQIGPIQCQLISRPGPPFPPPAQCDITFPLPFGGVPSVVAVSTSEQVPGADPRLIKLDVMHLDYVNPQGFRVHRPTPYWGPGFQMSGFWVAVGPQVHSGQGTAKYAVVNLIYAPPGSAAGGQSGSVTYLGQRFRNHNIRLPIIQNNEFDFHGIQGRSLRRLIDH